MKTGQLLAILIPFMFSCDGLLSSNQDEIEVSSAASLKYSKYSSSSEYDQMMSAGVLMIQDVSTELQAEGISLSEVKKFAVETEGDLKIEAGALNISTNLLLAESAKKSVNPFSAAAGIVLTKAGDFYINKKSAQKNKTYQTEVFKRLNLAAVNSLKKVKSKVDKKKYGTMYFAGAITKVISVTVEKLYDIGLTDEEAATAADDLADKVIEASEDSLIESPEDKTEIVDHVITGVMIGFKNNNDAKIMENAIEIKNRYSEDTLDASNETDFDKMTKIVLESVTSMMRPPSKEDAKSSAISTVVNTMTRIAIKDFDKSPEEISTMYEPLFDKFSDSDIEKPTNFSEMVNPYEVIDELAEEGDITDDQAEQYQQKIAETVEENDASNEDHSQLSNPVVGIFATDKAFAALKDDRSVVTWGDMYCGGDSSAVREELTGVTDIFSTSAAFAALKNDGSVVTWGSTNHGGDSSAVRGELTGVTDIFSTSAAFAALKNDGSVVTWGSTNHGGSNNTNVDISSGVTKIFSNPYAFAALKSDDSVVTWGSTDKGGDSSAVSSSLTGVTDIFSTDSAFAALKPYGSVVTWGNADYGGESNSSTYGADCDGDSFRGDDDCLSSGVTKIFSTGTAFIAQTYDQIIFWGKNQPEFSRLPKIKEVSHNAYAYAALKEGGSVELSGNASHGGEIDTNVDISSGVEKVVASKQAFAALLKEGGSVVTWGHDSYGGKSNSIYIGADCDGVGTRGDDGCLSSGVTMIVATNRAFAAVKDGSVVTWGNADYGGDSSSVTWD